jgi:uncharacterized protein (DUF2141 family)
MLSRPPPKEGEIRGRRAALAAIATLCLASAGHAGDLQVTAQGLRSAEGVVRFAVCPERAFLTASCRLIGAAPARAPTAVISDVPAGIYAVQAYHDENANGRLDRGALGRPREGMGFSRDARMRFGPPRFSDAMVRIAGDGGMVSLTMRYFR